MKRAGEQDLDNEFIVSGVIDKFRIQFKFARLRDAIASKYGAELVSMD